MWNRALPALSVLFVLGMVAELGLVAFAGIGAFLGGLGLLVAVWLGLNRVRHQPIFALPHRVGRLEPVLFVLVPTLVSVLSEGGWTDPAVTLVSALVLLGLVYVVTSYGLVAITRYVLAELSDQLRLLASTTSRAVPLLLLITMGLFITGETWQMASRLKGLSLVVTLGLFVAFGALFLASRVPGLLHSIEDFEDWSEVGPALVGSPLEHVGLPQRGNPVEPPLDRGERLNMGVVAITPQAVQITLVAAVVWGFFVLLGLVAVHPDTAASWLGEPPDLVFDPIVLGESTFAISTELLRVAALLAAFSGLSFTVLLVTDETYRQEFRTDVTEDLRRVLAVRLVDHMLHDEGAWDAVAGEASPPNGRIVGIDHVQLAMPRGGEAEAVRFYAGLLGLHEVPKPAPLQARGGCWFRQDDVWVHLGVDDDFRPARRAHPALTVGDLAALVARLADAGVEVRTGEQVDGVLQRYCDDPFGNRIELVDAGATIGVTKRAEPGG